MDLPNVNWKDVMMWLSPTLLLLVAGKGVRRILFLPFEWIASRTRTKVDDTILLEAQRDVGIDRPTLEISDVETK